LHVIASIAQSTGGPAKAVVDMAAAVAARGHAVSIYTTDRQMSDAERAAIGAPASDGVARHVFKQHWPHSFAASFDLGAALEDAIPKADIVHLHSLYLYHVWKTASICRRAKVPYLLRPHGSLDPFLWRRHRVRKKLVELAFQDRAIADAAALHYTAEEEMRLAAPYTNGAQGVVVPNGLDMRDYAAMPQPGAFLASHPELAGTKPVLFLSRINFKKGLDVLIPAFAKAIAVDPALRLVVAGPDDGYLDAAKGFAAQAGVADKVLWLGMLSGEAKKAAFIDCAAFALPSWSENFGIAIVEAMACGAPVIVSDRVNIWREIEAAGAGLVSPPEIDAVAAHILLLAGDPGRRRRMGEAGRRLVQAKYDWVNIAAELERVYARLAAA
jgi:glycosyltransferase involved in cell wall biosynthesis